MKESRIMQIQYATAILALGLVAIHLLMQGVFVPYGEAISFPRVLSVYRSAVDGSLLELLLLIVLAHGFNGLRIILLELRQGNMWTHGVNWSILIVTIAMMLYGTRTVLLAVTGVVS